VQFWLIFVKMWLSCQLPWLPLYMRKISLFLAEKWWVQYFAQIWLPWQPPWLPWNFIYYIWIRLPRKPFNYVIIAQNWNQCNFGLFLRKFDYHSNFLASLKIFDSIFEFADPKTLLFVRKSPRFLAQNWNLCNFGWFGPNLVAMVTPLAPLKF